MSRLHLPSFSSLRDHQRDTPAHSNQLISSCPTLSPQMFQPQNQHHQTHIRRNTQSSQHNHHIPTGPKPSPRPPHPINLTKKLPIPLHPPIQTRKQNPRPVERKQRADGIELGREDLEHDEGEAELPEGGADVGAFEGALGGADFDEFGGGEDDAAGAVEAEAVAVCGVDALVGGRGVSGW